MNQELIAQRLNLSRATVSRSLANHPAISTETRRRVQEMAAQLGYKQTPGRVARRGKKSRTFTIGVLIGVPRENVTMVTYPHILKGIRERAEIERVNVDVCYQPPAEFDTEASRQLVMRQIRSNDWRGGILVHPFPEPAVAMIAERISIVSALESYNQPGIDIIDTDDAPAILDLVLRLFAAGHRRIGFVSWTYPVGGHWVARRFSGYVEALFYQGLEFRPEWVINVHKSSPRLLPAEVSAAVARLFKEDHVTAWVCAADHQAYPLMQDLSARGIRVPEDCSITGFDGLLPPPGQRRVTSMRVPHEHIGSSALTRLMNRISHPASPRRKILVEGEFVEGETISPPHVPSALSHPRHPITTSTPATS
ncbi:MAG: LacI family DNA-binding transcriptional regulator [bacterium]|nr:LacI family DNA-binding transcriptional regulator [bacterium]MDI1335121.1 LacI family DNA-binding transcriptional regulator [Lacunisphaera sp.]